jgi:hypothetical protein
MDRACTWKSLTHQSNSVGQSPVATLGETAVLVVPSRWLDELRSTKISVEM